MKDNSNVPLTHPELSVTRWFHRLRDGDPDAAEVLWQEFFPRLVDVARHRFAADRDADYGADDAAASVLATLCQNAPADAYAGIDTRDDLWRLLVTSIRRKVIDRVRRGQTLKRGGEVSFVSADETLASPEPDAETLAMLRESLDRLLRSLSDQRLRDIAIMKMRGDSVAEIANHFDVSLRSIQRKLNLVRDAWRDQV